MKISRILFVLFSLLVSTQIKAQSPDASFRVITVDYLTNKKIGGSYIHVYKKKKRITTLVTDSVGKVNFNLKLGSEYKIVVGADGKVDRFFYVDLKAAKKESVQLSGICQISLFEKKPNVDYSFVLENAITRFYYESPKPNLEYEVESAMKMVKEIELIMKSQQ